MFGNTFVSPGGGVPEVYFSAWQSVVQSFANSTNVVVVPNAELKDSHGFYDAVTGRFLPLVSGTYEIDGTISINGLAAGKQFWIAVRKNGGTVFWGAAVAIGVLASLTIAMHKKFYFNGATDYIELIAWHDDAVPKNSLATFGAGCWFSGRLISNNDISGF